MRLKYLLSGLADLKGADKVAFNTIILYVQRILTAALSLVTTPVILRALGVEDYGIYTITVGLVGTLAFVNWSLSSATQRYIAYAIGEENPKKLNSIFASSFGIHLAYGFLLLVLIAVLGDYFIDKWLVIPDNRIETTRVVLYLVSVITFINIITVPFTGIFRAHENFIYQSLIGIIESLLKLALTLALLYVTYDRLIAYSFFLLVLAIFTFILNLIVSKRLYNEVNFKSGNLDLKLIKEMLGFMGWSLLGAIAILSRNQAVSVILNMFFGVIKNAAYGIAMQVNAAISILSQGIVGAISPKIIISAGAGDIPKMIYLMRTMSKFVVISISVVAIPFLFESAYILNLWLGEIPEEAVIYSQLIVCFGLVTGLSAGVQNAFEAIGRVKMYNIMVSVILILNIPASYVFFKLGFPSYTILIVGIALELISLIVRLALLSKYVDFSILEFLKDISFRLVLPIIMVSILVLISKILPLNALQQMVVTFGLFFTLYPLLVYFISIDHLQKSFIDNGLQKMRSRFLKNRTQ